MVVAAVLMNICVEKTSKLAKLRRQTLFFFLLVFTITVGFLQHFVSLLARDQAFRAPHLKISTKQSSFYAMAWTSSGRSNEALINNLEAHGIIKSESVKAAMLGVDRADYAPCFPYIDSPQSIGLAATISAPHMHATAVEALLPCLTKPNAKVLDIGSGSGYLCHVFANLVGESGTVVGVDHIQGLVSIAEVNMKRSAAGKQLLESGRVKFIKADGRLGYPPEAPFDAIHVGAAAEELHDVLVQQLKSPGKMFIPVSDAGGGWQYIWIVEKDENGKVKKSKDMAVRYVPLCDAPE